MSGNEKLKRLLKGAGELTSVSQTAAERIVTIVGSLRRFARLDEAELDEVDLHEGIENTLTLVQHELKNRIKVDKDYGEIPRVKCYPNQLNQVFMNLLVNASHAIEGPGSIAIKTRLQGGNVLVEFKDSGRGIPQENLQRISILDHYHGFGVGTGLGLSIVYRIVQDHRARSRSKVRLERAVPSACRYRFGPRKWEMVKTRYPIPARAHEEPCLIGEP